MITAHHARLDFATRVRRRALALAKRRARTFVQGADATNWRDPHQLWPDFTQD